MNTTKTISPAAAKYAATAAAIEARIESLRIMLKVHAAKQAVDPSNYGYVGDIAHVLEALDDIYNHMA